MAIMLEMALASYSFEADTPHFPVWHGQLSCSPQKYSGRPCMEFTHTIHNHNPGLRLPLQSQPPLLQSQLMPSLYYSNPTSPHAQLNPLSTIAAYDCLATLVRMQFLEPCIHACQHMCVSLTCPRCPHHHLHDSLSWQDLEV